MNISQRTTLQGTKAISLLSKMLEVLGRKKTIKDWLKKQITKIEKILSTDRHSKFDYTLKERERVFC